MEKKPLRTAIIILTLLLSAVSVTQLVSFVEGNPFSQSIYSGESRPSVRVNPPKVSIHSPLDYMTYSSRDVLLSLNVSIKGLESFAVGSFHYISSISVKEIYFTADWIENKTVIYRSPSIDDWINNTANYFFMGNWYEKYDDLPRIDFEKLSLNLTNVPDGNHTIRVYAVGSGSEHSMFSWYVFYVTGFSKVNFVVDTSPPEVTVLSLENKQYCLRDLPLNFTINEAVSQVTYSLDGQENVTIAGNVTLTGLPNGDHNVIVYATDAFGNAGASKTIYFNVEVPLPTTLVIAPIASVAFVGVGLMVYLKRKRRCL